MSRIRIMVVWVVSFLMMSQHPLLAQVPGLINCQGRVAVNGTNFTGTGQFHFSLVNRGTNLARQATAIAVMGGVPPNQFVAQVNVIDGGNGYTIAPLVTFPSGNAVAYAQVGGGSVTNIVVFSAGSGYSLTPVPQIAAPPPLMMYAQYWTSGASTIPVNKGLYSVLLGDTSISNMIALPTSVFTNSDVWLRVWFDDGSGLQQLSPDQRLAAAPYALQAAGMNATGLIGTVSDANLSANIPKLNAVSQMFTGITVLNNMTGSGTFMGTVSGNGAGLTNISVVTGAAGAGLVDSNTFFISSTAPAGGDGSMARPWSSLYALTNNAGGRLNNKTVILLAGLYLTSTDIVFDATYSNLTVKGWDQQNVHIVSTNNNSRIFVCNTGATNIVLDGMTMTSTNTTLSNGGTVLLQPGCTVQNCTFTGCYSYSGGGGVFCYYGGLVQNCTLIGNIAANSGYGGGGACCYYGGTIQNSTFIGNYGPGGGVGCYYGGTVQSCAFINNSSGFGGGGVDCYIGGTIQNCTFNGNYGPSGSAVYCYFGGSMQNCSIIRGGGTTNSLYSMGSGITWMSVWTNSASASGYVIWSSSLNN